MAADCRAGRHRTKIPQDEEIATLRLPHHAISGRTGVPPCTAERKVARCVSCAIDGQNRCWGMTCGGADADQHPLCRLHRAAVRRGSCRQFAA